MRAKDKPCPYSLAVLHYDSKLWKSIFSAVITMTRRRPLRNKGRRPYELHQRRAGNRLLFIHTEVPPEVEGNGIAARLTEAALEFARAGHFKVVPLCPYIADYISNHSEYQDLLSE